MVSMNYRLGYCSCACLVDQLVSQLGFNRVINRIFMIPIGFFNIFLNRVINRVINSILTLFATGFPAGSPNGLLTG